MLRACTLALLPLFQEPVRPVEAIRAEARAALPLVDSVGARRFLQAAEHLPTIEPRELWIDRATRRALRPDEHAALPEAERASFEGTRLDEGFYYNTRYGSPVAYARALDLVAGIDARFAELSGLRVLDFGYGGIGHLRMLASIGCDVVGVEVDDTLRALYGPEDQGPVVPAEAAWVREHPHTLRLVHGRWPAEESVRQAVGSGYDLVLSKNVLKKGYLVPSEPVDPRMLVDLGVSHEEFLRSVAGILRPGGLLVIYNLCPAMPPDRYVPWAEGQCPFPRQALEAAGLEPLRFDVVDHEAIRELGVALGWAEQGMDLADDLFSWYTIARRQG